ncbi:Sulfite exporter TauE/SafE [Planctomycetes bacterium Poly30]|uniref:Probable membrane transporter protein n=1 Tax=Saltatorellus ferox TaxID=2528018 RepID=A0A518ENU0_9BACT|nr:Sulfite exporter TauE/SafE [Planctomycetes bacterium Poly30]
MWFALAGALAVGLCLGLLGSGGSIITVPLLTYLVGQEEKVAIAGSLGIVGSIAMVASIPYARRGLIDYRSVVLFGIPGMAGAFLGASLSRFVSGSVQLAVFAGLMIAAAFLMLRPIKPPDPAGGPPAKPHTPLGMVLEGILVGTITGFVGVGGGFMIVPALVLLVGLPMHRAVGTSLMIIALNAFTGFYRYQGVLRDLDLKLDWTVIGQFSVLGVAGSFVGRALASKLPQQSLRRVFAVFLLVVSAYILWRS